MDKYLKILVSAFVGSSVTMATVFIFVAIIPKKIGAKYQAADGFSDMIDLHDTTN